MNTKDTGYAPETWTFDEEVTRVFADMLGRSIPNYLEMRRLVAALGYPYAQNRTVLDIGCSLGEALAPYVDTASRLVGYEISEPMQQEATRRFSANSRISIQHRDVTLGIDHDDIGLALGVLTMMFIPTDQRHHVLHDIYRHIRPGGAFIMVEKIVGETSAIDKAMVAEYYVFKQEGGYSIDEIERKRLSLRGVLTPMTARMNEDMLDRAGFSTVECFWRWMNFAGWIAVK